MYYELHDVINKHDVTAVHTHKLLHKTCVSLLRGYLHVESTFVSQLLFLLSKIYTGYKIPSKLL